MPDADRSLRARLVALARGVLDVLRGITFGRHLNRYTSPGDLGDAPDSADDQPGESADATDDRGPDADRDE